MDLVSHDGGGATATCKHCGAQAAGPCARCHVPLCGDCCVMSEGRVGVFAVCRDCAADGATDTAGPWAAVLRTFLLPIVGLALLLVLLAVLFGE